LPELDEEGVEVMGYIVGWIGVILGLFVAPPQLLKILKNGHTQGISLITYTFLCLALVCYLLHAIYIESTVFIVAQSINLVTNVSILILLLKYRRRR
jgi:uncharacterized protein with PQ loop repeat